MLSLQAKAIADDEENGHYYLDSAVTEVEVSRLNRPEKFGYSNGEITFTDTNSGQSENYFVEIELFVESGNRTISFFTNTTLTSVDIQEKIESFSQNKEFGYEFAQVEKIGIKVFAYISPQSTQGKLLLQSLEGRGESEEKQLIVEKMQYKGSDISITRIRECIIRGDMEEANHLLGYEYFVSAPVRHGNALGRTIGFPTANQLPPGEKLLPPNAVYAVHAVVNGKTYCGVCNIGRKPTIGGNYPVGIETFFFDFHGDIYDRDLRVSFVKFIRPEKKFASVEALTPQIERDKETCRRFFGLQ